MEIISLNGMMIVSLHLMRVVFTLLLLFIASLASAQSTLSIEISKPVPFVVYFNADSTSSVTGEPLQMDSVPSGLHTLDLVVLDSVKTLLSSSVILYDGVHTSLLIENSTDSIHLLIPSSDFSIDMNSAEQASSSRALQAEVIEVTSSNCPFPMNRVEFNKVLEKAKNKSFQRDRVKLLGNVVGVNCITSAQLSQALDLIDDEEKKLNLIIKAEDKIFDLRNAQQLSSQFILSRYQDQFNSWLIMVKNQG